MTVRGFERGRIFLDAKDRQHWVDLLAEAVDLWRLPGRENVVQRLFPICDMRDPMGQSAIV